MTASVLMLLQDPFIMLVLGLLTHFLADMMRIRKEEGRFITLRQYWAAYPLQTAICVIGGMVGLVALDSAGELTALNAFGLGYISNSIADKVGKRAGGVVDA